MSTQSIQLTINDLNVICQMIQLCTKRGAFLAEELEEIGKIYNKLIVFIKQTIPDIKKTIKEDSINKSDKKIPPSPLSQHQYSVSQEENKQE
jgi:hypothetical protein